MLRNRDPGNPNWEFLQMILDYKEQLEFNPLVDGDAMSNHQITVCIRYTAIYILMSMFTIGNVNVQRIRKEKAKINNPPGNVR